jgi:Zn-dependent protease/CBS domain-containing protein
MKWSWRIGQVAGIGIYIHFTFLILLGWLGLLHFLSGDSIETALKGLLFIIALFTIVVLHELGHAVAAKRYGIRTRDITLLPIGGVARLERMPEDPKQELVVALAGPAVNVVLAAVFFALIVLTGERVEDPENVMVTGGPFLTQMFVVNVGLVLFNLLPAFPMDGGRVLRALLAMRMDYVQATQVAASIGQGMALLFGFLGLFGSNPILLFIALFVWMGAAAESSMVQMKSALGGIPIQRAMITHFETLTPHDTLGQAAEHIVAGFQHDFPVLEASKVVGVLTRADLLAGLVQGGKDTLVAEVMDRQFETADPHDMMEGVLTRMQTSECPSVPVVRNGKLLGIVTADNLGEFLMIQTALKNHQRHEGPAPAGSYFSSGQMPSARRTTTSWPR